MMFFTILGVFTFVFFALCILLAFFLSLASLIHYGNFSVSDAVFDTFFEDIEHALNKAQETVNEAFDKRNI